MWKDIRILFSGGAAGGVAALVAGLVRRLATPSEHRAEPHWLDWVIGSAESWLVTVMLAACVAGVAKIVVEQLHLRRQYLAKSGLGHIITHPPCQDGVRIYRASTARVLSWAVASAIFTCIAGTLIVFGGWKSGEWILAASVMFCTTALLVARQRVVLGSTYIDVIDKIGLKRRHRSRVLFVGRASVAGRRRAAVVLRDGETVVIPGDVILDEAWFAMFDREAPSSAVSTRNAALLAWIWPPIDTVSRALRAAQLASWKMLAVLAAAMVTAATEILEGAVHVSFIHWTMPFASVLLVVCTLGVAMARPTAIVAAAITFLWVVLGIATSELGMSTTCVVLSLMVVPLIAGGRVAYAFHRRWPMVVKAGQHDELNSVSLSSWALGQGVTTFGQAPMNSEAGEMNELPDWARRGGMPLRSALKYAIQFFALLGGSSLFIWLIPFIKAIVRAQLVGGEVEFPSQDWALFGKWVLGLMLASLILPYLTAASARDDHRQAVWYAAWNRAQAARRNRRVR